MQKVNHEQSLPYNRRSSGADLRCAGLLLVAAAASSTLLAEVVRPESRTRTTRERYSWENPHARVLPTGNIEWAPRQFVFEKGRSVRRLPVAGASFHHAWIEQAMGDSKKCMESWNRFIHEWTNQGAK